MQYHLNGVTLGDPALKAKGGKDPGEIVDVLIVGCGPAGLTLAAQLAAFPDITTRITDRKSGPLQMGQADGIACRSVEMFQAFGFADQVMKEGYWVNEVAFWRPGPGGTLHRADRIQDVEDDLSEMPHIIVSQARIHDFYLDVMRRSSHRLEPDYSRDLVALTRTDDAEFPVTATFNCLDTAETQTIRARYVVGCDGARSTVRRALGHTLKGDAARQLWGVMDVLAVTDFPDIRLKTVVQTEGHGSLLIIPREGGYLVRIYVELDALHRDERAADRNVSADMLIAKTREVLAPHSFKVQEVAWWSAYEIGQRVCDTFDDVPTADRPHQTPRIFIAGDACHTHSPKAGQGMNVSMADTFNLGWKLASVLRKQARPELLHSYSDERQAKAQELIDFDRDMARLFSAKPKDAAEAAQFQAYFKKHGRYTAGVETRYAPSIITGAGTHQDLATGLKIGMRFHSSPVIRAADGKPMQLGHALLADGRWRIMAFAGAGDLGQKAGALADLCQYLAADTGPVRRITDPSADIDSVIDVRAILQAAHRDVDISALPSELRPAKGRYGLVDYEKLFCPNLTSGPDIFDHRGINRQLGAVVIVRPDQFVADIRPVTDHSGIYAFFDKVMRLSSPTT